MKYLEPAQTNWRLDEGGEGLAEPARPHADTLRTAEGSDRVIDAGQALG